MGLVVNYETSPVGMAVRGAIFTLSYSCKPLVLGQSLKMRIWNYSCCKYIADQLDTLWEIILNPWLPHTNTFHCHYSFEITQAYQDLIMPWRNSPSPFLYNYKTHFLTNDHGWVKAILRVKRIIYLNPLSSLSFPRIIPEVLNIYHSTIFPALENKAIHKTFQGSRYAECLLSYHI